VLIKEKSHEMVEHKGYFSALGDRFQIINKRVVLNDKKQAAGILGVIHDVTELKSRENSAWEGEAYYKLIYENSPVSAILFNSIYIIEEMNQAATEILSKPSVMIGHDISELFQNYSDFERVVGSENVPVKVKLIDGTEVSAITNTMYVGQSMRHSMIFIKADFIL
jgi:PAS domain-containing protein